MNKKILESLMEGKGSGTSLITIHIACVKEKLQAELGTAAHIKSRVNRQSVQRALKRCIERLKVEKTTPPNGAVLLCGSFDLPSSASSCDIETDDAIYYFEPPMPVKRFVYFCDKRFHLDKILPLFQCNEDTTDKYGICVVGGSEATISFYLPDVDQFKAASSAKGTLRNKHGRGGYSQNRYQRLRENDVHVLVVKMSEMCEKACFSPSGPPLVKGLVLVGCGERKKQVADRLKSLKGDQVPAGFITLVSSDGAEEGSLLAAKDVILELLRPKEEREAESEVARMVEATPDLLVFGEKEVVGGLEDELLRRVFILKDRIDLEMEELLTSSSAEVVCFNVCGFLEQFGGMIGVKYF